MFNLKKRISKLENTVKKQNDCEYCHDYTKKIHCISSRFLNSAWFSIYKGCIEVLDDRAKGNVLTFKIKYCPICGRKLD